MRRVTSSGIFEVTFSKRHIIFGTKNDAKFGSHATGPKKYMSSDTGAVHRERA
jgi:hypothetical protein